MDMGAMAVGGLIGLVIGLLIGGLIGGLLIMLGSKIVMGSAARFGSAFVAAIASGVAGAIIGFVLGFVAMSVAPAMASMAQIASLVIGFLITPVLYSAIVRTGDGRAPSYVQGVLIYLIQLAVIIAIGAVAVFVFRVPIPGMPAL